MFFSQLDFLCIGIPREDNLLLCADGNTAEKWNGCYERESYRIQCPNGYYPCNNLRDNSVEFVCGTDCSANDGKRVCHF